MSKLFDELWFIECDLDGIKTINLHYNTNTTTYYTTIITNVVYPLQWLWSESNGGIWKRLVINMKIPRSIDWIFNLN